MTFRQRRNFWLLHFLLVAPWWWFWGQQEVVVVFAGPARPILLQPIIRRRNSLRLIGRVRGGEASTFIGPGGVTYELNPNYTGDSSCLSPSPVQLGDISDQGTIGFGPRSDVYDTRTELFSTIRNYLKELEEKSPSVYWTAASCIVVFLAWQRAPAQRWLNRHFVCSRNNIRAGRWHVLLLAALSHADPWHLIFNLSTLLSFGPKLSSLIQPLWPVLVTTALAGHVTYLLLKPRGGCFGLSGVTCGLVGLYTCIYPKRQLGFLVGPIPVRLQAQQARTILLLWSLAGTFLFSKRSNVAHAGHLGGLLAGWLYYELFRRHSWQRRAGRYSQKHFV